MKFPRFCRVAFGFIVACVWLAGSAPASPAESDEQLMAVFKAESARLQHEMADASDDLAKVAELQKQMKALVADVMGKVSPPSRAALEVGMKIINPLMEGGIVYSGAIQKYIDAGGFDYASATSVEVIDRRLEELVKIEQQNDALLKRVVSLDADIEKVLQASSLSASAKAGFLKGFHSSTGSRLGALRAVRTLDTRLYAEVRGIYGQLREQMGKWSVSDGTLVFEDDAQVALYNARLEKIQIIATRQEIAQRRALGVE